MTAEDRAVEHWIWNLHRVLESSVYPMLPLVSHLERFKKSVCVESRI